MVFKDIGVTDVFGPGAPVLIRDVQCTPSAAGLHLCEKSGTGFDRCTKRSAGVVCKKSYCESSTSGIKYFCMQYEGIFGACIFVDNCSQRIPNTTHEINITR